MSWQPEKRPFFEPSFWKERLEDALAKDEIHHAVYVTDRDTWKALEEHHRGILARLIEPRDSVLDIGCGYGRLLGLLPADWQGLYLGIDLSPDLVAVAQANYPGHQFEVMDLRDLSNMEVGHKFGIGIAVSVRRGIVGHAGLKVWQNIEVELGRLCERLLYLDFDLEDGGTIL